MPYIYSDPRRANDPHALPDVEIFYSGEKHSEPGWYYQYGFPGCVPDGELMGPFETFKEATRDVYENADNDFDYEDPDNDFGYEEETTE